ncbi:alpha/beta hydrolase family protein [Agrococcus sp. SGAir0287]|uniref:alpha/beta hydrolase family protein n=1 Tax=Agrococcus sp. SGAir0287 TaxID=2070347 RepID=UPI0010CD1451|nr:alpha/beta hydrolase [Agrococcus sp. SGAir0287]QCR18724.1 hypothetical protein C1N71_04035 [Agrococcus sp. SGAir0287]
MRGAGLLVDEDAHEICTVVPTEMGDLQAILHVPDDAPLPGLVLVDGADDGDRYGWGGRPAWLADAGAVVLRHDRPGCGGSPGDWRSQTLEDRAHESLDAARVLRGRPATAGQPIGLYGVGQGGWVALLAATLDPTLVDFVIVQSGPATSPREHERERLERALVHAGLEGRALASALAWVDERSRLVASDVPIEDVLALQQRYEHEPWFPVVRRPYDDAASLRRLRGILTYDSSTVLPLVRCPVLVLLGAADPTFSIHASIAAYGQRLLPNARSGGAVLPDADQGMFVAAPADGVDRRSQLAPAYLPLVSAFLADQRR